MKTPYFHADLQDVEWRIEEFFVDYQDAISFMEERVEQIISGESSELIWILEHSPIYTLGTSAKETDILDDSIPFIKTSRGGQVTYHGPGQKIIYVMLKMSRFNNDLKAYIRFLKESVINALPKSIDIVQDDSHIGLWANHPQKGRAKIAFIGIRIRKGVSFHGISINVNPNLQAFSKIIPCGVINEQITSIEELILPQIINQ